MRGRGKYRKSVGRDDPARHALDFVGNAVLGVPPVTNLVRVGVSDDPHHNKAFK